MSLCARVSECVLGDRHVCLHIYEHVNLSSHPKPLVFIFLFFSFAGLQEENRGGQERVPESLGRVPSQSGFQGNAYDTQTPAKTDDGLDGKSLLMGWAGLPWAEVVAVVVVVVGWAGASDANRAGHIWNNT